MKLPSQLLLFLICCCASTHLLGAQANLISAKPPGYSLAAKAAGVDGPVILKGTISKEGKMGNIQVVSGPPELRQAAIDVVSSWAYKPYRHFGKLVETDTTVTVNFDMGKGQKKADAQAKAKAELLQVGQPAPPQDTAPKH